MGMGHGEGRGRVRLVHRWKLQIAEIKKYKRIAQAANIKTD